MSGSCLYLGEVEHNRVKPVGHAFTYPICYFFLDLDELKSIFNVPFLFSYNFPGILSFWRKDYLGPRTQDLRASVRAEILKQTGETQSGPIRLLTNISYFGHCFNPVSFYYCYSPDGQELQYILAEVTNTPWNERHQQVLKYTGPKKQHYELKKVFHVSPFIPMTIDYTWVFQAPGDDYYVLMQNRFRGEKDLMFSAGLKMKRLPLTGLNVLKLVARFPLMSFKPLLAIYWQALRLWIKKVPFYTHPNKVKSP